MSCVLTVCDPRAYYDIVSLTHAGEMLLYNDESYALQNQTWFLTLPHTLDVKLQANC
jgi:hypothetical protein